MLCKDKVNMSKYYNKKYNKWKCPLCGKGFPKEKQLKTHFKDTHPNHKLDMNAVYAKTKDEVR